MLIINIGFNIYFCNVRKRPNEVSKANGMRIGATYI